MSILDSMTHAEKMRYRNAAYRVTRVYPGPVGEILSKELYAWEEFGYRLGGTALINRLVEHILNRDAERTKNASADVSG